MNWRNEISLLIRSFINDFGDTPMYTNERICQLAIVAAQQIILEIEFSNKYTIDVINQTISPDPTDTRDIEFIGLWSLKSACLFDQSSIRTKAHMDGISTILGPAKLSVSNGFSGYKMLLDQGPCKMYQDLKQQHILGDSSRIRAILSPFVGNNFDPQMLNHGRSDYRRTDSVIT